MIRLKEIVDAIQQTLHLVKPLLFEVVLFGWAVLEMGRFMWNVVGGE